MKYRNQSIDLLWKSMIWILYHRDLRHERVNSGSRGKNLNKGYMKFCAMIWYNLYNLKVADACNFTKSNTPLWVFLTFLKLCKWYQIVQSIIYLVDQYDLTNFMAFVMQSMIFQDELLLTQ